MAKSPLTMQVMGGLGNQLHGYATGIAMAGKLNRKLIVDTSRVSFGSNLSRVPALGELNLSKNAIEVEFLDKKYSSFDVNFERLSRHSRGWIKSRISFEEPDYWDDYENLNHQLSNITKGINSVSGSFMNFDWASEAVKYGFPKVCNPAVTSQAYSTELLKIGPGDIAIHIRIGDYLKLQTLFPLIPEAYYFEALSAVPNHRNRRIVVFTDSPKQLHKIYPALIKRARLQVLRTELTVMETLSLMSKFKILIGANSTFSSWAGWFDKKEIVVTPTPHHTNAWNDYLPADWIRIPIETYN